MEEETTSKQPHDGWASYYDFVQERTHGELYRTLQGLTLAAIRSILHSGKIIDLGAGTGRMAIPLAREGYEVTAVERSDGMVREMERKCSQEGIRIPVHTCCITEYRGDGDSDLALALFTVVSYALTPEELRAFARSMAGMLRSGGQLFLDVPHRELFTNGLGVDLPDLQRQVRILPTEEMDLYRYTETCSGELHKEYFEYTEDLQIRFWTESEVDAVLGEAGLRDSGRRFPEFNGTHATYKLYIKA